MLPSHQSEYLCELNPVWDMDAQEYISPYGRFAKNDNFWNETINCRIYPYTVPGTTERELCRNALPEVRILAGEDFMRPRLLAGSAPDASS